MTLAAPAAHADFRGKVSMLVNPEAPRAEWRRIPLAGAYVAVTWSVTVAAPAHAITSCRYGELARSDAKGEYVMAGPNPVTAALADASFLAYSPGLEPVNFPYGGSLQTAKDITMALSTLTPAERLSRISGYADPGCPGESPSDPRGILRAYLDSLVEEARGLHVDSSVGRVQLQGIEAAARRASGADQPGPLRSVIRPSPAAIQSASPPPVR